MHLSVGKGDPPDERPILSFENAARYANLTRLRFNARMMPMRANNYEAPVPIGPLVNGAARRSQVITIGFDG
jgi:hypothetical protein